MDRALLVIKIWYEKRKDGKKKKRKNIVLVLDFVVLELLRLLYCFQLNKMSLNYY